MALSVAECDRMIEAAAVGKAVLAIGFVRRFLHAARFVKWAIDDGLLGRILSLNVRDGYVFAWPRCVGLLLSKGESWRGRPDGRRCPLFGPTPLVAGEVGSSNTTTIALEALRPTANFS